MFPLLITLQTQLLATGTARVEANTPGQRKKISPAMIKSSVAAFVSPDMGVTLTVTYGAHLKSSRKCRNIVNVQKQTYLFAW